MVIPLAFGWRQLLFVNWPVSREELADRVPAPLTVQEYDDSAWVSIIPFLNIDVRPRGLPGRLGIDVPEINVRTYVTHDGEPGVYFFSLDAHDLATVCGARFMHFLPYYYALGTIQVEDNRVRIESRRRHPGASPGNFSVTYHGVGSSFVAEPGSLAEFLTERRRLYTLTPGNQLRYTDVAHEPWPLYHAEYHIGENTLFAANRLAEPTSEPISYYSPGVDVVTSRSKQWAGAPSP